jgi:hypothetical protein
MDFAQNLGLKEATMAFDYKEAFFPPDYREADVKKIMDAIYKLRSVSIVGLAGMGKSNVVRFIVSHPEVKKRYLGDKAEDFAFIHIDCAGPGCDNERGIYEEILYQLREKMGLEDIPYPDTSDTRQLQRALRRQVSNIEARLNLAIIFDYFDEAYPRLGKGFFNYLAHLRNSRQRANISYVFATRRQLDHLYELQELLDDVCWIGPLSYNDALGSIRRDEQRLGQMFGPAERDKLIAYMGGHPGFLKNACELLKDGEIDLACPEDEVVGQLLRSDVIRNLCEELWNDLTSEEKRVLISKARNTPAAGLMDSAAARYLKQSGLLVEAEDRKATIFCRLFETFVRELETEEVKKIIQELETGQVEGLSIIAVSPNKVQIETPTGTAEITLPPLVFKLLCCLTEEQGKVYTVDEIAIKVYGYGEDVSDQAVAQLVKRLRKSIDPLVREIINEPTYTCIESVRGVGYTFYG